MLCKIYTQLQRKKWTFDGPHSQYCIQIHEIDDKTEPNFNYNSTKFIAFEKIMFDKILKNPFMKFQNFIDICNKVIKENKFEFKLYDTTYKNLFNNLKKLLKGNNESIIDKYILTENGEIFYRKSILTNLYTNQKGYTVHKIHIWMSDTNLIRMKKSKHLQ